MGSDQDWILSSGIKENIFGESKGLSFQGLEAINGVNGVGVRGG